MPAIPHRVLLLFYPELSARVIGIFYCQEIGSRFYMTRDRRYECYDGDWLVYLPVSIALIFVWVVGTLWPASKPRIVVAG